MRVAIALDRTSELPLQRQIYEEWRGGILRGRFRSGERVPSTRDLASTLGVARATVTAAYDQLTAEGYLESTRGSGTFVCRQLPEDLLRTRPLAASAPPAEAPLHLSRRGEQIAAEFSCLPPALGPGWISFSHWRPDLNHFPFPLWRALLARHFRSTDRQVFDYHGAGAGHEGLRREIAAYVARSRAVRCAPEDVVVVNGSQQALDLCARVLLDPGDEVAIEDPGYQGARQIFAAYGARLRPVPVGTDGVSPSAIGRAARLLYVTPSHQFPIGISLSVARRLELIEWARRHRAAILEDDYDSEYRYNGPPLPSMQGLAGGAPVIYIGTFSKVMFPGLRIGYLIAPPGLARAFARTKWLADRQTPILEQATLADFLREGHLERHIRRMRRLYSRRRDALIESLDRHFGRAAQVFGDPAGMHTLVRFEDAGIAARAQATRVYMPAAAPYYMRSAPPNEFILGFSNINDRAIREGVKRLRFSPHTTTSAPE
jgi:GntR family transcriptional regulator/MocR family aminotransferase